MKAPQLTAVRAQVTQIVRELGLVIHHCEEAQSAARSRWHAQVAEDLNCATAANTMVIEHAHRLDALLLQLSKAAQAKGGAS